MFDRLYKDLVALLAIFYPVGIIPQYVYFTRHESREGRRKLALECLVIATLILIGFIILGQFVLEAINITLPAFQIAGGLVLLVISLWMIFEGIRESAAKEKETGVEVNQDLAVFPLATPLIAGPGGILIVVVLTDRNRFNVPEQAEATIILLVVMVLVYAALLSAERVQRHLGTTGINVASRIMGLILAALSVQTALTGISEFFSIS